ncbi:MAG: DNA internalization-related competence protein ComEC/Rec2 [Candidatus Omnitrophota bacterium]
MENHISSPQREILSGVLLGLRKNFPPEIENIFVKTGTMHLLAISGLHVGLVLLVLVFLLKTVHVPRKARFFILILFLLLYIPFTGSKVPVIRASVMAIVLLTGFILERESDVLNSLGIAALGILLFAPTQIFSAGFQLSFICLLAIIWLSPPIQKFFDSLTPPAASKNKILFWVKSSVAVSLAAWIGTLPIIVYYFNNVSCLTILANLVAIPLLFLIIIFSCAFLLLPGFLAVVFGGITAWMTGLLLDYLGFLSRAPFGFYKMAPPSPIVIMVFYVLLILVFYSRVFRIRIFYPLTAALLVLNFCVWPRAFERRPEEIKINFFDVGFADSALIETPDGRHILIDGGSFYGNCGENIIAPYLWSRNIKTLDAVILSHPEADHFGGLIFIMDNFTVKAFFDNDQRNDNFLCDEVYAVLYNKKIQRYAISEGEAIRGFEDVEIMVFNPPLEKITGTARDLNNNSVVVKISYKDFSVIFPGDIQAPGLRNLMRYNDNLKADVIKMPHHGLENSAELSMALDFISPSLAVISAGYAGGGKKREIAETKRMLSGKNIKIRDTAKSGFISITSDGEGFEVETVKTNFTIE